MKLAKKQKVNEGAVLTLDDVLRTNDPNYAPNPRRGTVEKLYNMMKVASRNCARKYLPKNLVFLKITKHRKNGFTQTQVSNVFVETPIDTRLTFNLLTNLGFFVTRGKGINKEYKYSGNLPFTMDDAKLIASTLIDLKNKSTKIVAETPFTKTIETEKKIVKPAKVNSLKEYSELVRNNDDKINANELMNFLKTLNEEYVNTLNEERQILTEERVKSNELARALNETLQEYNVTTKRLINLIKNQK